MEAEVGVGGNNFVFISGYGAQCQNFETQGRFYIFNILVLRLSFTMKSTQQRGKKITLLHSCLCECFRHKASKGKGKLTTLLFVMFPCICHGSNAQI